MSNFHSITPRERALATLELRDIGQPSAALLSAGCWTINRQGYTLQDLFGRPDLMADLVVAGNVVAPSDIVWLGSGYHNLAISALGGELKFRKAGPPDVKSALLAEAGDVAKLDLSLVGRDANIATILHATRLVSGRIGGKVLVGASQWGPFTLTGHLLGVEKVMRGIVKDPESVRKVLDFAVDLTVDYLAPFRDYGAEIVSIAEPSASGDLISRTQFESFALPYLKRAVAALKNRGLKVIVHICGNVTTRLDLLAQSGADLISVDYKVDLALVRQATAGKLAFSGNLNPVAVVQNATPEEVRAAALAAYEKAGSEPGYMLMPGCDIPPTTPLENIRTLLDTARNR
jgi:uroporphyrinogen decarboxylase